MIWLIKFRPDNIEKCKEIDIIVLTEINETKKEIFTLIGSIRNQLEIINKKMEDLDVKIQNYEYDKYNYIDKITENEEWVNFGEFASLKKIGAFLGLANHTVENILYHGIMKYDDISIEHME